MKTILNICFSAVFSFAILSVAHAEVRDAARGQVVVGKVVQVFTAVPGKIGEMGGVYIDVQAEKSGQVYSFTYEDSTGCAAQVFHYFSGCTRVGRDPKWSKLLGHRVHIKQVQKYWTTRKKISVRVLD